jgi:hypothetical protein
MLGNINHPANVISPPNQNVAGAVFECTIDVAISAASDLGTNINLYSTETPRLFGRPGRLQAACFERRVQTLEPPLEADQ